MVRKPSRQGVKLTAQRDGQELPCKTAKRVYKPLGVSQTPSLHGWEGGEKLILARALQGGVTLQLRIRREMQKSNKQIMGNNKQRNIAQERKTLNVIGLMQSFHQQILNRTTVVEILAHPPGEKSIKPTGV